MLERISLRKEGIFPNEPEKSEKKGADAWNQSEWKKEGERSVNHGGGPILRKKDQIAMLLGRHYRWGKEEGGVSDIRDPRVWVFMMH